MRVSLIALFVIATLPAQAFQIFEGALRRESLSNDEGRAIVKVSTRKADGSSGRCTGFFVKNRDNKPLVATARHCAQYDLTLACKDRRVSITTQFGAHSGVCRKTVVSVDHLDMAIIEVRIPNWRTVSREIDFLELSEQAPRVGTEVKMLGYPGDRNGQFTITENCAITDGRLVEFKDYPAADQQAYYVWRGNRPDDPEVVRRSNLIVGRRDAFNNCSVYGGNSGGPIIISNSNVALGMPTAYWPKMPTPQPSTRSTSMDTTARFIRDNRAKLIEEGVVFAQPYQN